LVVHPRDPNFNRVDRDFVFLMSSYDIEPGTALPKVMTMTDFNLWTWNSRVFPGIDPLVVRQGDRVRIRVGNLTMTNHPIHMHGPHFEVTCTDGGWVRESARWPEVTTDIPVGGMRAVEFIAEDPGDWAIHCHKSHHTMNAMGHGIPNVLGVSQAQLAEHIRKLVPGYMAMGEHGMAEHAAHSATGHLPLPENTLPMMMGTGPFGPLEMGGMFTVLKVREDLHAGDYRDPGWYRHPPGTVARKISTEELQRYLA
ncbi:MAG: multicopper oxidase domain-containing protein, partial [Burkholderiales bacterium]|nr:multicopper oxidase domain-containing protein [Burkholderiales bacterium]